jgi:[ribosomal protein S5]-alanine N-acetyltransferase
MFTIETPRLILRDLLESDLQPFFALASDPAVTRFQSFIRCADEDQARAYLRSAEIHNKAVPRFAYNLAILRKADGAWLGWFGMGRPEDPTLGDLDFGYGLRPAYWGQGYMTEVVKAMVDFSLRDLGIQSIFAECDEENPASARVMEKAGLRLWLAFEEFDEAVGQVTRMRRYGIRRGELFT